MVDLHQKLFPNIKILLSINTKRNYDFFQCFINSVIQCFSNTRAILEYSLSKQYLSEINTVSSMKGKFMKSFSQLIQALWKNNSVYRPTDFKNQVQDVQHRFQGNQQHDAMEFLHFLISSLHEEVNRADPEFPPLPYLPSYYMYVFKKISVSSS